MHAEAEYLLRTTLPVLLADHVRLADDLTALALSRIEAPAMQDESAELRRADAEPVFTVHGAERYTSQAARPRLMTGCS
jgi:hypothetical protein